jgi:hypothetical protein
MVSPLVFSLLIFIGTSLIKESIFFMCLFFSVVSAFGELPILAFAHSFFFFFFFGGHCGLNSGLHASKAGAVPLESQLHSILLWLFRDGAGGSLKLFTRAGL